VALDLHVDGGTAQGLAHLWQSSRVA
jgi:hypothetical protein